MKSSMDVLAARIAKEKALSDAIRSTLDSIQAPDSEAYARENAQAQIKAALAIAKAGGALPDSSAIQKSLGILSRDASDQFASALEFQRYTAATQNDLAALGDLADSALSVDQQSLDSLNEILAAAQKQIDLLKGIDVSMLTVASARAGFQQAIDSAKANPYSGSAGPISTAYQSYLGRAPDAAGLAYWQNAAANGNSMANIIEAIKNSDEAMSRKIPGFANG
ncbi:DUF4214 domain-containing protein, partial [Massilia eurypsychrophila]